MCWAPGACHDRPRALSLLLWPQLPWTEGWRLGSRALQRLSSDPPRLQMWAFHRKPSGKLPAPGPGELSQRDTFAQAAVSLVLVLGRGQGAPEGGAQELDGRQGR